MTNGMKNRHFGRRTFLMGGVLALGAGLVLPLFPTSAFADQLDSLRASGAVGEAFDGYARARDASANAFVKQLNDQRRGIYAKRAAAQGVSADQVGRVYAEQIIQKAPKGTWLLRENGQWVQK